MSLLEQQDQFVEEPADPLGILAFYGDLVPSDHDEGALERVLDQPQQLVALAQQAHHEMVAGHSDLYLGRRHWRLEATSGPNAAGRERPPSGASPVPAVDA